MFLILVAATYANDRRDFPAVRTRSRIPRHRAGEDKTLSSSASHYYLRRAAPVRVQAHRCAQRRSYKRDIMHILARRESTSSSCAVARCHSLTEFPSVLLQGTAVNTRPFAVAAAAVAAACRHHFLHASAFAYTAGCVRSAEQFDASRDCR